MTLPSHLVALTRVTFLPTICFSSYWRNEHMSRLFRSTSACWTRSRLSSHTPVPHCTGRGRGFPTVAHPPVRAVCLLESMRTRCAAAVQCQPVHRRFPRVVFSAVPFLAAAPNSAFRRTPPQPIVVPLVRPQARGGGDVRLQLQTHDEASNGQNLKT